MSLILQTIHEPLLSQQELVSSKAFGSQLGCRLGALELEGLRIEMCTLIVDPHSIEQARHRLLARNWARVAAVEPKDAGLKIGTSRECELAIWR